MVWGIFWISTVVIGKIQGRNLLMLHGNPQLSSLPYSRVGMQIVERELGALQAAVVGEGHDGDGRPSPTRQAPSSEGKAERSCFPASAPLLRSYLCPSQDRSFPAQINILRPSVLPAVDPSPPASRPLSPQFQSQRSPSLSNPPPLRLNSSTAVGFLSLSPFLRETVTFGPLPPPLLPDPSRPLLSDPASQPLRSSSLHTMRRGERGGGATATAPFDGDWGTACHVASTHGATAAREAA